MAITDWPAEQRPRERLIKHGPQVLSDAELLAVFLRVGVAGKSAVDLGRSVISDCHDSYAQIATIQHSFLKQYLALACQGSIDS